MRHDLVLTGCVPTVLASYLKALGIHRLISEQLDPGATAYWDADDRFVLCSTADRGELLRFFNEVYAPTPMVTPWNGGGGFYPGDQKAGIDAIAQSEAPRFRSYRENIEICVDLLKGLQLDEKPEGDDKLRLLRHLRARLTDEAIPWIDAAVVIGEDARYPALLGTGGNDGRLDFANNFMQRLAELFLVPQKKGRRTVEDDPSAALQSALFAEARCGTQKKVAVGQFVPGSAGGTNMTSGVEGESRVNPWDYLLALEGSLAFAGAALRRLDANRSGTYHKPHLSSLPASFVGHSSSVRFPPRLPPGSDALWSIRDFPLPPSGLYSVSLFPSMFLMAATVRAPSV